LDSIYKLLNKSKSNYKEKRFLISSYENFRQKNDKIYLTDLSTKNSDINKHKDEIQMNKSKYLDIIIL
jgi:hypothetical protein